jgi:hypothetical protein
MAVRLGAVLPRLALVAVFLLGGTASLAFATQQRLAASQVATAAAPAPVQQQTLRVPDVQGQAYVFAKGILEDAGFAWRVAAGAHGYATNIVAAQLPVPGSKVVDTGAPLVRLTLVRNPKYKEHGAPEDAAPYNGTSVLVTSGAPGTATTPAPTTTAAPAHKAGSSVGLEVAPKSSPSKKHAKPAAAAKPAYPQHRPPAFAVAGAPKEPLDELPLRDRARLLDRWLNGHRTPTTPNVRHWLYQHAWIVTGARFGWWRGADALRILIAVDRRVVREWGVGNKSELAARRALAVVEAKTK